MVAWNAARLVAVRRSLDLARFWADMPPVTRPERDAPLGLTEES